MNNLSVQVRITSVRSVGKHGGVIFSGRTDAGNQYVIVCSYKLIHDANLVEKGQLWKVSGSSGIRESVHNGYTIKETQIEAEKIELIRPSGLNIISWIANCTDCPGVGQVKARKLYDRFGPALIEHIQKKDIAVLSELISNDAALRLCNAFDKHEVANTLLWLDTCGINQNIGASVVAYYKNHAQAKIEANPYLLISFEANWTVVDALAFERFDIQKDDPRRLQSAIEESLYRALKIGHTCIPEKELRAYLSRLLDSSDAVNQALAINAESTQYRHVDGRYQPTGTYLIESYVAKRLHDMTAGEDASGQAGLFAQIKTDSGAVEATIDAYEKFHGIVLTQEQRDAVLTSSSSHLSLILGGAGTGKTTVLKALFATLEELQPGVSIYQLALAGRAAQRMAEATGRESMTIAGFLTKIERASIDIGAVIVIDEVSMVDVILMYRLLRHLPQGVRLILVGDPAQLPPIGPGLLLHALIGIPSIPQIELKIVKRQSAASGIPQVAAAIRAHQAPQWAQYLGKPGFGVSLIPCAPEQLDATVQRIYTELGGNGADYSVEILCATNAGFGGVKNLNAAMHERYRQGAQQVHCHHQEFGVVGATTIDRVPLKVGDLVIYTENDYQLGLRNGALGTILKAFPVVEFDDPCCLCGFEGVEYFLTTKQMQALNHAYAITIHKSQGSQFQRVIIPIRETRLLDHSLIYTAVTRCVDQVILVGDESAVLRAIEAPASAVRRNINLPALLREASLPMV